MKEDDIFSDQELDGTTKATLLQALWAREGEQRRLSLEENRFSHEKRGAKWSTPLAIALTGVITIAANLLVSWVLASQSGSQAITQLELQGAIDGALASQSAAQVIDQTQLEAALSFALAAEDGARAENAANLSFQYEIMRTELSRFSQDDPEANLKRGQALLFLTRAGLLKGLNVEFLSQTAERAITAAGGDVTTLPIPNLGTTITGPTSFSCPDNDQYPPATFQDVGPRVKYQVEGAIRNQPVQRELVADLAQAVSLLADDIVALVFSAGQDRLGNGRRRVGSIRHDVDCDGYGYAVDFFLQRDGDRLGTVSAPEFYGPVIEAMSRNWPSLGFNGTFLHIDGYPLLAPSTWASTDVGGTIPRWANEAYQRGRQMAETSEE